MKKMNFNCSIKVKLDPYGREIYEARYGALPVDKNGFVKFQLWDFMNLFGGHFGKGNPVNNKYILEDGCIYIDEDCLDEV